MKAVGYAESLPITDPRSLVDLELPTPEPGPHDLLVKVEAVSVNPVDAKMRMRQAGTADAPRVLGWDATGTVVAMGSAVTGFRPGDAVAYAGAIDRPGSNSALHLVDARIVGPKPASLGFAEAAALPLTALTAWEMLFDRLQLAPGGERGRALLVIGGAGGVGSIAIQLARRLTEVTVIATASRPETVAWVERLGAHHVIDHGRPMPEQLRALGLAGADWIFSTNASDRHWAGIVEAVLPQGRVGLIDDPEPVDVRQLKRKSASLHWELMFTRSLFGTPDIARQGEILREVARLVDEGVLVTTLSRVLGRIDAATLRRAHADIESGRSVGKTVLAGF